MPAGRVAGGMLAILLVCPSGGCRDDLERPGDFEADCRRRGPCGAPAGGSTGTDSSGGETNTGGRSPPERGGSPSTGGGAVGGAAGEAGSGSDGPMRPGFSEVVCRSLGPPASCLVEGTGSELVVAGDVLTETRSYLGGEVVVRPDGTIACAGCDCRTESDARRVTCPGAVVAPAFVNPHDHVAYAHEPPRPGAAERYEHRHDWRLGVRGHTAIDYEGGASAAARAAHELRMVMDGVTAIAGGAGHVGLLRNLDVPNLEEDVLVAPAGSDTFPLDDADGLFVASGCAYGAGRTRPAETERYGAYLPHLGEGVDAEAENEVRCALEAALVGETTGVVHAVAVTAMEARALGARRALVVWSPRSNIALYGNTAPVTLFRRSGVEIAIGTDWLLSGSMTVRRELECARSFSERHLDGELDARSLVTMATRSAARAIGAGVALGRIRAGYLADIQIVRRGENEPHEAVLRARPSDVALVLRGGVPLYGDSAVVEALAPGEVCETLDVCGTPKAVCLTETGRTLAELVAASPYPLFACNAPPNEPSCVPWRPGEYDGVPSDADEDGDGVANDDDLCPRIFDPVRPLDGGRQADADVDGRGDACDPCPLDAAPDCVGPSTDDLDADGIPDDHDACPLKPSSDGADRDADGIGDACDFCASPNPGVSPCPLALTALRNPTDAARPPRHALVRIDDASVVALRPDTGAARGYYIEAGIEPFSGIFAFTAGASPNVAAGDQLTLRGRLDVYQGTDELVAPLVLERVPSARVAPPALVAAASVGDQGTLSERYESMLVRIENVAVAATNPDAPADYDETLLEGALRIDDLLDPALDNTFAMGTRFRSVTGVLGNSFGHWKLWPRGPDDLVLE